MRDDDLAGIPARLGQMDEAGVLMQVLSARHDSYAELAQKYPGRFAAVVSLPLPHIDASLREMERGLDQLGMLGVSMTCSCFDRSTAEAEFEPLYQENQAPRQHPNLPEPPSVTARRFYYDTVGHGSQAALLCAWKAFGADQLVAGSDYPVLMALAEDVDKILNHNAQRLLGIQ
jgi:predicted TIM-barrel fold metal-dependent hydrolase